MEDKKFDAILTILVPSVIQLIVENYCVNEIVASEAFYKSGVYALLEQEDTKIWHLSPLSIFNMFDEEHKTGVFEIPEEAA